MTVRTPAPPPGWGCCCCRCGGCGDLLVTGLLGRPETLLVRGLLGRPGMPAVAKGRQAGRQGQAMHKRRRDAR